MQTFSSVLSDLYQASENFSAQPFQQETFRLLRRLLFFDGALSGVLTPENRSRRNLLFTHVSVYGRSRELVADYQAVASDDPAMRRLLNGSSVPYDCSCLQLYRERQLLHLFAFARKHEINEVLIFGQPMGKVQTLRWISLFRRSAHPFDAEDVISLHAWWPHLLRATQLNLRHVLDSQCTTKSERAVALLDALERIEVSDRQFADMLHEEWPKETGGNLPKIAWDELQHKGWFKGRTLSLSIVSVADYTVCEAQRLSGLDRLGALERSVALLVAEGHDYKTIAEKMGTSPNTVRNQISRIYKKLNVHDKLSLALLFHRAEVPASSLRSSSGTSDFLAVRTGTHARSLPF